MLKFNKYFTLFYNLNLFKDIVKTKFLCLYKYNFAFVIIENFISLK